MLVTLCFKHYIHQNILVISCFKSVLGLGIVGRHTLWWMTHFPIEFCNSKKQFWNHEPWPSGRILAHQLVYTPDNLCTFSQINVSLYIPLSRSFMFMIFFLFFLCKPSCIIMPQLFALWKLLLLKSNTLCLMKLLLLKR